MMNDEFLMTDGIVAFVICEFVISPSVSSVNSVVNP